MFVMNDSLDVRAVSLTIEKLRNGETKYLRMYSDEYVNSDEYVKQFANDDDYAFWLSEKAKHSETKNVA